MSVMIKVKIQNLGRFLSAMIMPNISIFIAWGIINGLFTPSGWLPNHDLEKLLYPMTTYLFPIVIANTGGYLIHGKKGAIVSSIAVLGAIVSTSCPMLLGAMVIGPLGGWVSFYVDKVIKNKIKSGFEMLVTNFSISIIGVILSIISFFLIGPIIENISYLLGYGVNLMVCNNLLPFISILVEPAKILFLNNVINHGVLSPLGVQEVVKYHKSIFFLVESNPGPGFGVLMAWFLLGYKTIKKSLKEVMIIQLLGGIHEVYFPYALMNPRLIIALVLGSMTGIFTLMLCNGGLISAASPGSIIAILIMTPKGKYLVNFIAVFFSFLVSFIVSSILLKINNKKYYMHNAMKNTGNISLNNNRFIFSSAKENITKFLHHEKKIRKIVVACDAGMGSSAVAAGILRKKLNDYNVTNITVLNTAINVIPNDVDLIITHRRLTDRARVQHPCVQHLSLNNFLDNDFYNKLSEYLKNRNDDSAHIHSVSLSKNLYQDNSIKSFNITKKNIFLNQIAKNKEEAIRFIGMQLVKQGYVKEEYIEFMLQREKIMPTWLGESIALPHGTCESKNSILNTGIIFCQFPKGVLFGDNPEDIAYLVIGVAARNDEHIKIVSSITNALDNDNIIRNLSVTDNIEDVLKIFSKSILIHKC